MDDRLVAFAGLGLPAAQRLQPLRRPHLEELLAAPRVDPVAAQEVGLDGAGEALRRRPCGRSCACAARGHGRGSARPNGAHPTFVTRFWTSAIADGPQLDARPPRQRPLPRPRRRRRKRSAVRRHAAGARSRPPRRPGRTNQPSELEERNATLLDQAAHETSVTQNARRGRRCRATAPPPDRSAVRWKPFPCRPTDRQAAGDKVRPLSHHRRAKCPTGVIQIRGTYQGARRQRRRPSP